MSVVCAVDGFARGLGAGRHEWWVRIGCGATAVIISGHAILRHPRHSVPAAAVGPVADLTEAQIIDCAKQAWQHANSAGRAVAGQAALSAGLFAELLTDNQRLISADEDVKLRGDIFRAELSLEIEVGDIGRVAPGATVAVPVVCPASGSGTARDAAGEPLATAPRAVTHGYLALAFTGLFRELYAGDPVREFTADERAALLAVIRLVCHDEPMGAEEARERFDKAVAPFPHVPVENERRLRDICLYFAHNTVATVLAPVGSGLLQIRYAYVLQPYDRLRTRHDRIRTLVGLRPYRYRIPLTYPFLANSYHLRVVGPPVQFVYRHLLCTPGRGGDEPSIIRWVPPVGVETTLRADVGLPYAEVWTRHLDRTPPQEVECVVEFEEIPPGALGQTLVISAVSSALVVAFAFMVPRLASHGSRPDLAALLLGVLGLAATWVGQSAERVKQSSLTTYAGLAVAGGVSLLSALLYVLQAARWISFAAAQVTILHRVTLPSFDPAWAGLGLCSLSATIVLVHRFRHRMSRYLTALARRQSGT